MFNNKYHSYQMGLNPNYLIHQRNLNIFIFCLFCCLKYDKPLTSTWIKMIKMSYQSIVENWKHEGIFADCSYCRI